jgi:hypothetical protein
MSRRFMQMAFRLTTVPGAAPAPFAGPGLRRSRRGSCLAAAILRRDIISAPGVRFRAEAAVVPCWFGVDVLYRGAIALARRSGHVGVESAVSRRDSISPPGAR